MNATHPINSLHNALVNTLTVSEGIIPDVKGWIMLFSSI